MKRILKTLRQFLIIPFCGVLFSASCSKPPEPDLSLSRPHEFYFSRTLAYETAQNRFEVFFKFPYSVEAEATSITLNGVIIFPTYLGMRYFTNPEREDVWAYSQAVESNQEIHGSIGIAGHSPFPFVIDPATMLNQSRRYVVEIYSDEENNYVLYTGNKLRYGLI